MAKIKKYQAGGKTSLGMKSVKAGFDKNPGVTRADIIVAAKKEAKGGAKLKKQAAIAIAMKAAGKKPKKARGGASLSPTAANVSKRLGSRLKNGGSLTPSVSSVSKRLASYGRPLGKNLKKAMNGATASSQRKARAAASIGRQASAMRKARTAARPMMKMGGKCRGGCY